jgi:glutamate--cysteine ligase
MNPTIKYIMTKLLMHKADFQTPGFEKLELSTQLVIREAHKRGYDVEVIDWSENVLRISNGETVHIVEKATMTDRDTYITSRLLGNKALTKRILTEQGITVPTGEEFSDFHDASDSFERYRTSSIVIKPKSTNFGIGVHILSQSFSKREFDAALQDAFSYDRTALIEYFIEGIEYRFLVIGFTVRAVLYRDPAHVVGDDKHTIEELVLEKNQDPWRGPTYAYPLIHLRLGNTEIEHLAKTGLTPTSIPKTGEKVYLRSNSNISTGGDSIDVTDTIHESYKNIAQMAAKAFGAHFCGIDMIIFDCTVSATENNYAIIEANYNPAIHIHKYPAVGTSRAVECFVLDEIFNETTS